MGKEVSIPIILIGIILFFILRRGGFLTSLKSQDSPFGFHPAVPYDEAKKIGVRWTREGEFPYLFWSIVDPEKTGDPAKFNWQHPVNYDLIFDAQKFGLSLVQNIQPEPSPGLIDSGQVGNYSQLNSWLPVDEIAYRNFVKEAIRRYSFINYWQIGNEPNMFRNLSDFAELQRITYEAIKEANPQIQVLMGGVEGSEGIDEYFESILSELQGKSLDIFDIHFYGDAKGGELIIPRGRAMGYQDFKTVYDYFRNLLDRNGFSHIPIWVTETGTFSGMLSMGLQQTELEQAIDLIKRYVYPLSMGVKKVFWFSLMEGFGPWNDDFFDHTGLIYGGQDGVHGLGEKKLGYYAFWLMTDKLEGSDWDNIQVIQESDGIYIYKFTKQGNPIWVAWNDNLSSEQITISGIDSAQIKITEVIPKYESGKDVISYNTAFNTEIKSVDGGELTLTLEDIPVFIERA